MSAAEAGTDAVDAVRTALEGGFEPEAADLAEVEARLARVRRLGGRFALVDAGPQVGGMLKAVGRGKLVC